MDTINLVFYENQTNANEDEDQRGMFPSPKIVAKKVVEISTEQLKKNMQVFLATVENAFIDIPKSNEGFSIKSITLNLSIDVSGKVALIAELGASANSGISVTLERKS